MESLESKLDRLSPEQRKEVEDFVEFLLSRSGPGAFRQAAPESLPAMNIAPPPLLTPAEPAISPVARPAAVLQDTISAESPPRMAGDSEPSSSPFHEIGGGVQDRLTDDYMDYGRFEPRESPATEAVKKIRRRIVSREDQDKPHHLLDWVD